MEAYIVKGYRTAVAKSKKGGFKNYRSDDMAVDGEGIDPPTDEWMQRARMAAETDGIIENAPAKRQKVCKSCCTKPLTLWGPVTVMCARCGWVCNFN